MRVSGYPIRTGSLTPVATAAVTHTFSLDRTMIPRAHETEQRPA